MKVFKKLDHAIFEQLKKLKASEAYAKFNRSLNNIDDTWRSVLKNSLSLGLPLLPFIPVFVLWSSNSQTQEQIELKKEIMEEVRFLGMGKQELAQMQTQLTSPRPFTNVQSAESNVQRTLVSKGLKGDNVKATDYKTEILGSLVRQSITYKFQRFGLEELKELLSIIIKRQRGRLAGLDWTGQVQERLLKGEIQVHYFSKADN